MRPQTLGIKQGANRGTFMQDQSASPYKLYKSQQIRTLELKTKLNFTLNRSAAKYRIFYFQESGLP
jgi:hypothetical protein